MSSLHKLEPTGEVKFVTGLKIAHLALKHRYIVIHFVPVTTSSPFKIVQINFSFSD